MAKGDKLNAKQRLFAAEYCADRNATKAARRAGYSSKTAYAIGQRLLKNVEVARQIEENLKTTEERCGITLETILVELRRILLSDAADALDPATGEVLPLKQWPLDLRRALSGLDNEEIWAGRGEAREQIGVVKKMRFWSKTEAAQQLLRVLGAFKDKVEVKVGLEDLLQQALSGDVSGASSE